MARLREMERFLNQERALRLQDIHRNYKAVGNQKVAEAREAAAEARWSRAAEL